MSLPVKAHSIGAVSPRGKRAVLLAFGLVALSAAFIWSMSTAQGYRVLACDSRYSVSSFKLSRGHEHDMWDADPAELTFGRWLGSTAFTRRIRAKLLAPVSWFRTHTAEPSLAFIVRLKGEMSDADLAGLSARLTSGTNSYNLENQGSARTWGKHSVIKCWRSESAPATNAPLELRISFTSGAEVARIAIPANRPEFARPLVAPGDRKRYVAEILNRFLEGKIAAGEALTTLHDLYEEYNVPDYLTPFEMIYYDHYAPGAEKGRESLNARLQSEASEWLKEARAK